MIRTGRFTLNNAPQRVDVGSDDMIPSRSVLVIAQEAGTVVVCEDENGYATGARILVVVGQPINFSDIVSREEIWLASVADLDIDIVESGVS